MTDSDLNFPQRSPESGKLTLSEYIAKLEADKARLVAALEFYADDDNWVTGGMYSCQPSKACRDDGFRAQEALKEVSHD